LRKNNSGFSNHNKVALLRGGKEYFDLLIKLIDEAEESIHLQTYIFDEDETGTLVAEALIRAASRDVKVYVLLDGYGSQSLSKQFISRLTDAGIYFRRFRPWYRTRRFYLGRRLHHKVIVVDSWRCTVSGLNISNRYNDTEESKAWLDWALYVEGEIAVKLLHECETRLRLRHTISNTKRNQMLPDTKHAVRVRVNDRLRGRREIYDTYLQMFKESSEELIIMSAYFLPGREFRKNIVAAVRRGVKIKVVLTGNADVFLVKYAERFIYRWLFKNKIEVFEYRKNVLHGKIAVSDCSLMTIGSYNVNNLSAFASIELNLDVKDAAFVKSAHDRLQSIIEKDCVKITETKFNRQFNYLSKFAHWTAYGFFRMLFFLSVRQKGDHW
jgi:cardiolipin synthase A/B